MRRNFENRSVAIAELFKGIFEKLRDYLGESLFFDTDTDQEKQLRLKMVHKVLSIAEYLSTVDYDLYPPSLCQEIDQGGRSFASAIDRLIEQRGSTDVMGIDSFKDDFDSFIATINRIIPVNTTNTATNRLEDSFNLVSTLLTKTQGALADSNKIKSELTDLQSEIQTIADGARSSAQDVIVTRFGIVYEKLSHKQNNAAKVWLGGIGLIICALCWFSYFTFEQSLTFIKENENLLKYPATMVIWIGSRLVIYSALFVGLSVCNSNYKANRHNQILNKHRQNALNTFETFVKSSSDDKAIKDAILMEVTRTIFGVQNTGFSSAESEGESNKVVEIIKSFGGEDK